jgi:hypothetical protein
VSSLYFRFSSRDAFGASSALLDRLLARADACSPVTEWRAAVAARDGNFEAAPIALFAAHGELAGSWACLATPVRYTAEMSNVRLARDGILRLSDAAAAALAADFNDTWRDSGIAMKVGRFADLFCIFDTPLCVVTHDPEAVLDRHIEEFLPQGAHAPRLRRLMSEIEMWLFEHEATRDASNRKSPGPNALWLWGGGMMRNSPDLPGLKSAGDDPVFSYFHGDVSRGGIVVGQTAMLEPAVAALQAGRIELLKLSAADRCFSIRASHLKRFWRRARPWQEHFQ